jgi:hypothetical protein
VSEWLCTLKSCGPAPCEAAITPGPADCVLLRAALLRRAGRRACVLFLMLRFLFNGCFQALTRAYRRRWGGLPALCACGRAPRRAVSGAMRAAARSPCQRRRRALGCRNTAPALRRLDHRWLCALPHAQCVCVCCMRRAIVVVCMRRWAACTAGCGGSVAAAALTCCAPARRPRVGSLFPPRSSKDDEALADKVEEELWVTVGGVVSSRGGLCVCVYVCVCVWWVCVRVCVCVCCMCGRNCCLCLRAHAVGQRHTDADDAHLICWRWPRSCLHLVRRRRRHQTPHTHTRARTHTHTHTHAHTHTHTHAHTHTHTHRCCWSSAGSVC